MKTTRYRNIFLALIAFAMPQVASATLLVGWYDFDFESTAAEDADFEATDVTGTVTKGGQISRSNGGSNDGFYGDSTFAASAGGDGYLEISNSTLIFSLTNNSTDMELVMQDLFFDAAIRTGTGNITANYQIVGGASGILGSRVNDTPSGANNASFDYKDLSFDLGLIPMVGKGQTINFLFTADTFAKIDNVGITGISVIPEPSSLLALGVFLSSGFMLRSRRNAVTA